MTDADFQLLETYLDGELSASETTALRARLASEPTLAQTLRALQGARAARGAFFDAIEPGAVETDRVVDDLLATTTARPSPSLRFAWFRHASALAACLILGFVLGQSLRAPSGGGAASSKNNTVVSTTATPLYEVAITDEAGNVVATQQFNSLDQARQFSEDLRRSQEQQEQLFSAHATVRSDRF